MSGPINVTYQYVPESWDQSEFIREGGFVVAFLNYNKGEQVESAAKSALSQDWPCLEIFMLDDASTDGSGDLMERIARTYRGRHKVTVVRNLKNRGINGQWNIVANLTTGRWLGMFCGDDDAFPDRVSIVASILKDYPDALGICTNALIKGTNRFFCKNRNRGVWSGENGPLPPGNFLGGMAFWSIHLFEEELPLGNIDDMLLQHMAMIQGAKKDTVSLIWALDVNTVSYSLGGLTNAGAQYIRAQKCKLRRLWLQGRGRQAYARKNGIVMWRNVMAYANRHLPDGRLKRQLDGLALIREISAAGWFGRLWKFLSLFSHKSGYFDLQDVRVRKEVKAIFLMYFLGLVSYVLYWELIDFRDVLKGLVRK